jgi:cytochrome c553
MKTKICDGCGLERPIWKSSGTGGLKLCKNCWSCHKSGDTEQKPTNSAIPRVSAKRAKKDAEYSKLRQRYLTTDVHHPRAGKDREVYYLVQSTWLAVCRNCHDWVHSHPEEARTMGWLK